MQVQPHPIAYDVYDYETDIGFLHLKVLTLSDTIIVSHGMYVITSVVLFLLSVHLYTLA